MLSKKFCINCISHVNKIYGPESSKSHNLELCINSGISFSCLVPEGSSRQMGIPPSGKENDKVM